MSHYVSTGISCYIRRIELFCMRLKSNDCPTFALTHTKCHVWLSMQLIVVNYTSIKTRNLTLWIIALYLQNNIMKKKTNCGSAVNYDDTNSTSNISNQKIITKNFLKDLRICSNFIVLSFGFSKQQFRSPVYGPKSKMLIL